jgi:hypothetical protein
MSPGVKGITKHPDMPKHTLYFAFNKASVEDKQRKQTTGATNITKEYIHPNRGDPQCRCPFLLISHHEHILIKI